MNLINQRIIKFRAYDNAQTTTGMMSPEECLKHFYDCYEIGLNPFEDKYLNWMQFTGIYDMNGKEIYEGDIVKDIGNFKKEENIRRVVYITECAGFVLREQDDYFNRTIGANNKGECSHLEVIGNIYENPELLLTLK